MADPVTRLTAISKAPVEKEAFESWLRMDNVVAFLKANAREREFVMYATTGSAFMHAVLVPAASVNPPDIEDLMDWNSPLSSWGIEATFGEPTSVSIVPPLHHTGSKTLDGGEALVFGRSFEGRVGKKSYYEVLQKFTHVFDLHWMESRNAYCRLDKHGDVEDAIRVVGIPARGTGYGGNIITFNRELLDEYLVLTDSVIARMFDVTCYRDGNFSGWSERHDLQYTKEPELFYKSHVEPGHASYMRGGQIVRPLTPKEIVLKRHSSFFSKREERQYASFIAVDWKNGAVREISTEPGQTANYFTKSDLPFEVSPAFFRPEVLSKYKADSEKYRLQERPISCRGAWHLQTYDINDAGQVHTYIVYLRSLPYEEQLHWKSYNEPPKGGISKRAFTTDFEGTWDHDYNPLHSLKGALQQWDEAQVPWWALRAEPLPDKVHYPVTSSHDEWANEILNLDQLIVEGFETKWLRTKAQELGRTPDAGVASLKLIEECLIGIGLEESDAQKAVAPLKKLHALRSKLKGHASGEEATAIRKQILAEHASYKNHFRTLTEEIDQSIRAIEAIFTNSYKPVRISK